MEPTRGCSLGSTTSVRLTPSAPGGHCSASAVPISKTRMAHAATVLRMIPFKPLGGGRCVASVVAGTVEVGTEADRFVAIASRWNVGPNAPLGYKCSDPVGVISTVRQQHCSRLQAR